MSFIYLIINSLLAILKVKFRPARVFFAAALIVFIKIPSLHSSVERFLEIAYDNRYEAEISRKQVEMTRWRMLNAARFLGPSVILEYQRSEGETDREREPYTAQSYGVRLEQTIFQGGAKFYTYRREKTAHQVARYSLSKVMEEIKEEVKEAYFKVLMNKSILRSYRRLMPQIEIEYEMARQQYQKEFITNIDYEEITNLRESIRIRKEMVKDELVVDEMQLKSSLGLSYEDDLEVREFMDIPTLVPPSFSIDESIEIALENRYEKKIADLTARQTEYEQRAAIGRDYPEISLEGFMGRSGQVYLDTDPPMADQWSVFLNLRWSFWGSTISGKYGENRTEAPIFHESLVTRSEEYVAQFSLLDGISHIYDKAEKEILKLQAIRDQRLTGEHVAQEVEKQYRNLLRSMELVEVTRKRLDVSRRNVDVVNKRRLLGEATIKDVIDAKHEGVQIESSLYENIFRFYLAAASLNRSCGMEIFPVNIWR